MTNATLNITEVPITREITIDWNEFTWGDLLKVSEAKTEDARTEVMEALISKLTGEDITSLPAVAVVEITTRLGQQLNLPTGGGPEAKN